MGNLGIKDRIKFLLANKKYSINKLANNNDSERIKISRQINGEGAVSLQTIELILTTFPDVSAEWLLRGEGTMDKAGHFAPQIFASNGSIVQTGHNRGDAEICSNSQHELYGKDIVIAAKDAEITALNTLIAELRQDKHNLNMLITSLTNNPQLLNSIKP